MVYKAWTKRKVEGDIGFLAEITKRSRVDSLVSKQGFFLIQHKKEEKEFGDIKISGIKNDNRREGQNRTMIQY